MRYEVEVEWTEASRSEKITRTTFAFDWAGARAEYASLFAARGPEAGGPGEGPDGDASSSDEDGSGSTSEAQRRRKQREGGEAGGGDAEYEALKKELERLLESQ
jgi:hypothetical protein